MKKLHLTLVIIVFINCINLAAQIKKLHFDIALQYESEDDLISNYVLINSREENSPFLWINSAQYYADLSIDSLLNTPLITKDNHFYELNMDIYGGEWLIDRPYFDPSGDYARPASYSIVKDDKDSRTL